MTKTFCRDCEYCEEGTCRLRPPFAASALTNYATFPKIKEDWFCYSGSNSVKETVEEPQLLVETIIIEQVEEQPVEILTKI